MPAIGINFSEDSGFSLGKMWYNNEFDDFKLLQVV